MATKMNVADYLNARGWVVVRDRWHDPLHYGAWPGGEDSDASIALADALAIQRARDAAEERRCVADAIANAASRFAKLDPDGALPHIMQAAATAQLAWLRMYGVEVER